VSSEIVVGCNSVVEVLWVKVFVMIMYVVSWIDVDDWVCEVLKTVGE